MIAKKRYYNPHQQDDYRTLHDFILWKVGYYDDPMPPLPVPQDFVYPLPTTYDPQKPTAIWINHSTFFIQVGGIGFLTDPIWSRRCSPLSFFGPIRHHAPSLKIEDLPKIDCVLISHNHYDHLDAPTVKKLSLLFPHITWLVPQGVKEWFTKRGITHVFECQWWDELKMDMLKATFVPAQHFSGRKGYDTNSTLWGGWVIEVAGKCFYFVGDTGYNHFDFKDIGNKWHTIDLALIPIGSYVPRRFMSPVHIEPADAVKIHQDIHSRLSIGMHWKTFRLSDEPSYQPPYDLFLALKKAGINPSEFLAPSPGVPINW